MCMDLLCFLFALLPFAELPPLTGHHALCPPRLSARAEEVSEDDLRDQFYPYGELKSVKKVASRSCAFVTYATREAAERAADELANK